MYKPNIVKIAITLLLSAYCSFLYGQGNIPLYVSKTTNTFSKYSGSNSKTTDKYESGNCSITTTGPISYTLSPNDFSIAPKQSKTWNGSVFPDVANAPARGTSAAATLTGTCHVSYSRPVPGNPTKHEIVNKDTAVTINFTVYSIKTTIAGSDSVCQGDTVQYTATGYPAGGQFQWSNGKTGPQAKYVLNSTGNINVTYTISGISDTGAKSVYVFKQTSWGTFSMSKDLGDITIIKDALTKLGNAIPGNPKITGPTVTVTFKSKSCCYKGTYKTIGDISGSGDIKLGLLAKDIPLAGLPWTGKFDKSFSKFGYQVEVTGQWGVFLSVKSEVKFSGGYSYSNCTNKGCFFGGASIDIGPELKITLSGSACLKGASGTGVQCKGIAASTGKRCEHITLNLCEYCWEHTDQSIWCFPCPSLDLTPVTLTCPLTGAITYNDGGKCGKGLAGSASIGPVKFKASVKAFGASFSWSADLTNKYTIVKYP